MQFRVPVFESKKSNEIQGIRESGVRVGVKKARYSLGCTIRHNAIQCNQLAHLFLFQAIHRPGPQAFFLSLEIVQGRGGGRSSPPTLVGANQEE